MIIGITGKAGAGKDTVGKFIESQYGFVRRAFATPIKQMLAVIDIHEPPREHKELPLEGWGFSYRRAAQLLGTEWGRALHDEIWINAMSFQIDKDAMARQHTVITDVRFENEADMIRRRGGVVIHVTGRNYVADKPKVTWWDRLCGRTEHKSEQGIKLHEKDWVIVNDGDMQELFKRTSSVIAELEKEYHE
jgi:hypothetical protein